MMKAGLLAVMAALLLLAGCDMFVSSATRLQRAERAVADNDYGRAIVELRNVVQAEPDNLTARAKLIEALLLNSDFAALDVQTAQLAGKDNIGAANQALLAKVYIAKHDFDGLLAALDSNKLHLDPQMEKLRRAQALLGLRKHEEAGALLQDVLRERPDDAEARLAYVQVLMTTGAVTQALAELDTLLSSAPQDARAWAFKGFLQSQQGMALEAGRALANANRYAGGRLTRAEELSTLALLVEQRLLLGDIKAAASAQKQLIGFFPAAPVSLLAAGQVSFAQGDYADAVSKMQTLLAKQPDMHTARWQLARALAAQGNERQAESDLRRLISDTPQNASARLLLAQIEMKLGQHVEVLQILAPVALISNDPQVSATLIQAQAAVAGSAKELGELTAAAQLEPANEALRLVVATTLLRAGQAQQAIDLLRDERQAKFTARRVPLLLKAVNLRSNPGEARAEAERIAASHTRDPVYMTAIATFFASAKDYAAARMWLERALSTIRSNMNPQAGRADGASVVELAVLRQLIAVELAADNQAVALSKAQAYRQTHPDDIDAVLLEAELQMELRHFEAAAQAYQAAFNMKPVSRLVIKLAQAKYAAGSATPYAELSQWLTRYPEDISARLALADGYLALKQPREAIGEYEKIIDAQPRNMKVLNNLAWLYQQQGDKRAEAAARAASALSPNDPTVADTLGWILMKDGKAEEALKLLGDAAAKSQQPDIQYHYAAALSQAGKQAEARERLQTLLAQHPQFEARSQAEQALKQLNATTP